MFAALRARRASVQDADDAVQDALEKIRRSRAARARLAQWEQHKGYFVYIALNCWRTMLRSEQARRRRERRYATEDQPTVDDRRRWLRERLDRASLTDQQRSYLEHVLGEGLSIEEIARRHGTSDRAARAVVQRATEVLRATADG